MLYTQLKDEDLVMLTLAGEQNAYEALVARYEARVIAVAESVTHSRYMAEDAAQDAFVTAGMVEKVLEQFRGDIMQIPPMYSAIKVNGQKLYDLARKGREVERQPRPITIHELTLLGMDADGIHLRVRCSKGTYIRTLCKDIGEALGCGGCMAALRRVAAGEYTARESVPLQTLLETENPEQYLRPVDSMFRNYPRVTLTPKQETRCRNGNSFSCTLEDGTYRAYSQAGEFLMLAKVDSGVMSTIKSFWAVSDS